MSQLSKIIFSFLKLHPKLNKHQSLATNAKVFVSASWALCYSRDYFVKGELLTSAFLDKFLHSHLTKLFEDKDVFPQETRNEEDECDKFAVFRSLRKASST